MAKFEDLIKSKFEEFIESYKKDKAEIQSLEGKSKNLREMAQMGIEAEFEYLNVDITGINLKDDVQVISKINELIEHFSSNEDISNQLNQIKYFMIEAGEQEKKILEIKQTATTRLNDTVKLVNIAIENFEKKKKEVDEKLRNLKEQSKIDKEHENMNYNEIQALELESAQLQYAIDEGRKIVSQYDTLNKIDEILKVREQQEEQDAINWWLGRDEEEAKVADPEKKGQETKGPEQKRTEKKDSATKGSEKKSPATKDEETHSQDDFLSRIVKKYGVTETKQENKGEEQEETQETKEKDELIAKWKKIDKLSEAEQKDLLFRTLSFSKDILLSSDIKKILIPEAMNVNIPAFEVFRDFKKVANKYHLSMGFSGEKGIIKLDSEEIDINKLRELIYNKLKRRIEEYTLFENEQNEVREIAYAKLEEILKTRENEEETEVKDPEKKGPEKKGSETKDPEKKGPETKDPETKENKEKEEIIAKWKKIDELSEVEKKYLMLETLSFTGDELIKLGEQESSGLKIIKKADGNYYYFDGVREEPVLNEYITIENISLETMGQISYDTFKGAIGKFSSSNIHDGKIITNETLKDFDEVRKIACTKIEELLKIQENSADQLPKVKIEFISKTGKFTVKSEDKKIKNKEFTFNELVEEFNKEFETDDNNNTMDNAMYELLIKVYGKEGVDRLPEWDEKEIAQYLSLHIDLKGVYGKQYDLDTANEIVDWTNRRMVKIEETEGFLTVNKGRVTQFLEKYPQIAKAYNGATRFFNRIGQKLLPAPKEQKQKHDDIDFTDPNKVEELTEHQKFVLSQVAPEPLHERKIISQIESDKKKEEKSAEEVNKGLREAMNRYRNGQGNEK